jgi:hypothetical protein
MSPTSQWNHNIHYSRLILGSIPPNARSALDVGRGEGGLCAIEFSWRRS